MDVSIDHKSDDSAVKQIDRFVIVNGKHYVKMTTKGW